MKANELRHGNFIKAKGLDHIFQFMWPIHKDLMNEEQFSYYLESIEPIELNEEWLKRMGFQKYGSWFILDNFQLPANVTINVSLEHKKTTIGRNEEYDTNHLEFVHQVMNLYFALTGHELEIK